jgi:hypothetical protein
MGALPDPDFRRAVEQLIVRREAEEALRHLEARQVTGPVPG